MKDGARRLQTRAQARIALSPRWNHVPAPPPLAGVELPLPEPDDECAVFVEILSVPRLGIIPAALAHGLLGVPRGRVALPPAAEVDVV